MLPLLAETDEQGKEIINPIIASGFRPSLRSKPPRNVPVGR
jgi:hypothetical protein